MTDNELLSDVVTYLNGCRNNAHCGTVAYEQFSNWISAIQRAASVVKCEDCKYGYHLIDTKKGEIKYHIACLKHSELIQAPDWYCADGERKDDDG